MRAKFGVDPESIPDYLALVGDSADGFPGLPGWGAKSAGARARRTTRTSRRSPPTAARLGGDRARRRDARGDAARRSASDALLFRTARDAARRRARSAPVDDCAGAGPRAEFARVAERLEARDLQRQLSAGAPAAR